MTASAKCENMGAERKETANPRPDGDAILMSEVAGGSEHALREQSIAAESSRADILAVIFLFLPFEVIKSSPISIKSPLCVVVFF